MRIRDDGAGFDVGLGSPLEGTKLYIAFVLQVFARECLVTRLRST